MLYLHGQNVPKVQQRKTNDSQPFITCIQSRAFRSVKPANSDEKLKHRQASCPDGGTGSDTMQHLHGYRHNIII